ncbi:unnamed protein product [Clonostachys chloroleuca]|uniref:Uncharacterized protein n=1 Tax=Clonostachys chloroleuca TaxID=1926264 RepID=A0AA35Q2P0_9HYPO|nr:unnamed protein product [Clonostachys chloroleuca]
MLKKNFETLLEPLDTLVVHLGFAIIDPGSFIAQISRQIFIGLFVDFHAPSQKLLHQFSLQGMGLFKAMVQERFGVATVPLQIRSGTTGKQ